MGVLEIPQRLLGGGPLFPVRLHRIAKLGQRGLGGQNQTRSVTVGLPGQQIGDRIGSRGERSAASAGRTGGRAAGDGAGGALFPR